MKNIIGMLLLLTVFLACSNENELPVDKTDGEYITLGLNKQAMTRASEAGDDTYNENTISKIDIFFYKDEECVFYPENITINNDNTVTIKVQSSEIGLFDGGPYTVYAIANGTFSREELQNKSINQLKSMLASTTFTANAENRFLMDGLSENIFLTKNGSSGNVDLYRAAAKITLEVTVKDNVTGEDGITWTSLKDQMTISLCNGVNTTHVNTTDYPYTIRPESDFFTTVDRVITEGKGHKPFYSYPNEWNTNPQNETYLLLTVPWSHDNLTFQTYYYRIPINNQYKELVRNSLYKIKLNVSILGSSVKEEPVVLTPNYLILDWSTKEIPTDLEDYKYLVLDKNFVVMNNVNEISIGYASSSEIKITFESITKPNIKKEDVTIDNIDPNANDFSTTFDNKEITFSHTLTNIGYKDYVPYTIKLKVEHKNNPNYVEYLTIIQYPAMYVEAEKNSGKGIFIYNNQGKSGSWDDLVDISSGGNHNKNMYIINVSAFDSNDSGFRIGDVRSNTASSGSVFGLTDGFNSKVLTYYYPSREKSTQDLIAPKFRIASSYGKCSGAISYSDAKKRCAAYQEEGNPAGRWRVPSQGELQYIAMQSSIKNIPYLFSNNAKYWTSTGQCTTYDNGTVTPNNTTSGTAFVRCVYDEWYWTDKCQRDKFTWGDKER